MKDLTDKLELDVSNAFGRFYSATQSAQAALAEDLNHLYLDFGVATAARAAQAEADIASLVRAFSGAGANPLVAPSPLDPHATPSPQPEAPADVQV